MVPSKLLIGSVVGVGSVSTAAVVAHQHGLFSTSSKEQSPDATPDVDVPRAPDTQDNANPNPADEVTEPPAEIVDDKTPPAPQKPNQEAIKKWLTDNSGGEDWKIQIKKDDGFDGQEITEDDLQGLSGYLNSDSNKELLKSLFPALEPKTLIFELEKTGGNWKYTLTTEDIEKWVNKTSQNKAALKLGETNDKKESKPKELKDIKNPHKLLKDLFDGKSAFEQITLSEPKTPKNILFERDETGWKHAKTKIDGWLTSPGDGNSKFTIKIQTSTEDQDLDKTDENNLIGLFSYLKENKDTLPKLIKESKPASLTFKKETKWDVVHNETTINNWVKNTSEHATLKVEDDGVEKKLDQMTSELKQLFESLKRNEGKFTSLKASTNMVFTKDGTSWKHIKKALTDLLTVTKKKTGLTIKISKNGSTTTELSKAKDEELIGLYKYINERNDNDLEETASVKFLVFKKDAGTWSRDKALEKNK